VLSPIRHKRSVAATVSFLAASTVLLAAGAQAADTASTPLVLTAYSNGAGGKQLLEGNYAEALAEIRSAHPAFSMSEGAKDTNLCVAYAAARQLAEAKSACDAALKAAKYDKMVASHFTLSYSNENAYIAIAYANRAVVHMLQHDEASAKTDLEHAKSLAPEAEFVARNVAAVTSPRSTIAQLEVSPSR
jgi:Flp pilus assembly protein TadD